MKLSIRFARQTRMGAVALAISILGTASAADPRLGPDPKEVQAVREKAVTFLRKQQAADGSFSAQMAGPGVSSLVVAGMLRSGYKVDDPLVAKAMIYLEKQVKKDGGIYDKGLANYTTCVALMAFQEANTSGKYQTLIKNATRFLKGLQFDEKSTDPKDARFGGVGYDKGKRPDLSNQHLFVESLLAAGVPKDDPALQNALKFISRCQNLPGEHNDQPFAKKTTADDRGGLTYTPIDPDDSPHKTPDGGLRSLGAMTYAGLKSFLYAGLSKDDPRVKAAIGWIRSHYTLNENPGQGQAGLYYYYHTFAKAMAALGEDLFVDKDGKKHDWRKELFEALKKRQRDDGSWMNMNKEFGEGDPNLATAFALLSLSYCEPSKK